MGGEKEQMPPPLVTMEASENNSMDKLCAARFKLYPIVAELETFWENVQPKYVSIQPEFGAKVRGMLNRVPRQTWVAAHDRRRATELKHWSSLNYHSFKQELVKFFLSLSFFLFCIASLFA